MRENKRSLVHVDLSWMNTRRFNVTDELEKELKETELQIKEDILKFVVNIKNNFRGK